MVDIIAWNRKMVAVVMEVEKKGPLQHDTAK